jgi:hypothetical protein
MHYSTEMQEVSPEYQKRTDIVVATKVNKNAPALKHDERGFVPNFEFSKI